MTDSASSPSVAAAPARPETVPPAGKTTLEPEHEPAVIEVGDPDELDETASNIDERMVPPNVKFEIDDVESPWAHSHEFDFIFCRYMVGSITDWPKLMNNIYENTNPGGWVEFQDYDLLYTSDDGSLTEEHQTLQWKRLFLEACEKAGRDPRPGPKLKDWVREADFVNITHKKYKMPVGPWPKDPYYKEIGICNLIQILDGLEAFSLRLFCGVLGWTKDEVLVMLALVRKELKAGAFHARFDLHVVYAQKPKAMDEE
ncbi:putative methyltransferase domain-containing protein [Colletotrichum sublineola]|uniref:Putative methyltransferase domain-containing protein n=1 Tax=Colletotrichum sublineola TaxID=1173701 RepID=A0A066XQ65_COLSU|nr:putative methyltransferase domain-containing protein [Colletotrichum sublineola]